jgi:hypothetical protein
VIAATISPRIKYAPALAAAVTQIMKLEVADETLMGSRSAVIVGYGFMEHGLAKLTKGQDTFANILQAIGVPAPHLMAWLTVSVVFAN